MLENIKSSFFIRLIFSNIKENNKLKLIRHNKSLQKKVNISINNYKLFSGRYIIYETKEKEKGKEYKIENDLMIYKGEYLKDKRHGKGKEYDNFGYLIYEGEYKNGKRNGKGKEYYRNGNLKFSGEYLNNKQWNGKGFDTCQFDLYELKNGEGTYEFYHINGFQKSKGAIINGTRKEFNDNADLIFEGEYKMGERNGKGKEYNDNGQLIFEGEYLNGNRFNGKEYDNFNNIFEYKRGIVFKKEYYDNNNLKFDGTYIDGKKYGIVKEYYYNGKLKFEGEYYNGFKLRGKLYYPEGNLKFEGEYLFNKKWSGRGYDKNNNIIYELNNGNGNAKEYYSNGNLKFDGKYLNGKKNGKRKRISF